MLFTSVEYLLFLLIAFFVYWIICSKNRIFQNGLLVIASLVFYGSWDWRCLGLVCLTAISTIGGGNLLSIRGLSDAKRRLVLITVLLINLGILFYFKYFNFFIQ